MTKIFKKPLFLALLVFSTVQLIAQKEITPIFPVNNSIDVNVGILKWLGETGCTFDLYFGTSPNPPIYKDSLQNMEEKSVIIKLNQKYYWKIVEKKNGKITRSSKVFSFSTLPIQLNNLLNYGTLVDSRDYKIYATIAASGTEWMAQNLDYELQGKSWYYEDNVKYKVYGRLYGGNAIASNMENLCPMGWHIPSVEEWEALLNNSGGIKAAGSPFKEASANYWQASKSIRSNNSGMTVLPSGSRDSKPSFSNLKKYTSFWTSTSDIKKTGNYMNLNFGFMRENAIISTGSQDWAYSIRCVKD